MNRTQRRKAQFKAALAYAGKTVRAWCEEQNVTTPHLYQVLSGDRESARLLAEVESFIAKHTPAEVA